MSLTIIITAFVVDVIFFSFFPLFWRARGELSIVLLQLRIQIWAQSRERSFSERTNFIICFVSIFFTFFAPPVFFFPITEEKKEMYRESSKEQNEAKERERKSRNSPGLVPALYIPTLVARRTNAIDGISYIYLLSLSLPLSPLRQGRGDTHSGIIIIIALVKKQGEGKEICIYLFFIMSATPANVEQGMKKSGSDSSEEPIAGGAASSHEEESRSPSSIASPSISSDAEDVEEEEDDEEEEKTSSHHGFASLADALKAREEALALYNKAEYDAAMQIQYRLVRYAMRQHKGGPTDPRNGTFFLDYGLSQLRQLQTSSGVDDILSPEKREETEKEMEACFVNLDIARVCFKKQLSELEEEEAGNTPAKGAEGETSSADLLSRLVLKDRVQLELIVAEIHNALAQLLMERGDYSGALREFDTELLIYRCLEGDEEEEEERSNTEFVVPPGRMVACLYGAADCFLKEADFEGAEERLQATLDLVRERYPPPIIDAELVEELEEWLADAKEMKGGKYLEMQQAIQQQFAREEMTDVLEQASQQLAPEEQEGGGGDEGRSDRHGALGSSTRTLIHGASLSSPWAVPSLPPRQGSPSLGLNERSQSNSLFPPQDSIFSRSRSLQLPPQSNHSNSGVPQGAGGAAATVHSAVVMKKAKKPRAAAASQDNSHPQHDQKRLRTE
eukprot:gene8122-5658_t